VSCIGVSISLIYYLNYIPLCQSLFPIIPDLPIPISSFQYLSHPSNPNVLMASNSLYAIGMS